eukprot:363109-Chlamydomonas_euryale.AAC.5
MCTVSMPAHASSSRPVAADMASSLARSAGPGASSSAGLRSASCRARCGLTCGHVRSDVATVATVATVPASLAKTRSRKKAPPSRPGPGSTTPRSQPSSADCPHPATPFGPHPHTLTIDSSSPARCMIADAGIASSRGAATAAAAASSSDASHPAPVAWPLPPSPPPMLSAAASAATAPVSASGPPAASTAARTCVLNVVWCGRQQSGRSAVRVVWSVRLSGWDGEIGVVWCGVVWQDVLSWVGVGK